LRLSQDFATQVGVKKALLTIPVRKPSRQEFVRVHPDAQYRLPTSVLELKGERDTYLVNPPLWSEVGHELVPVSLMTAITKQNVLFLWPVKLPTGRENAWHASALEAAQRAMKTWVSVRANMDLGAYDVFEATGSLSEPEWPAGSLQDFIKIAFKGRFIADLDHPVLKRLRGAE